MIDLFHKGQKKIINEYPLKQFPLFIVYLKNKKIYNIPKGQKKIINEYP